MQTQTNHTNSSNQMIEEFQDAINNMDCFSQEGFSEIAAIARLAIKSLNNECQKPRDLDDILQALHSIWCKADDMKNLIDCEAEKVGCNYISEATKQQIQKVLEENSHE